MPPQKTGASSAARGGGALPNLGDGTDMSTNAERRLGDRIARSLYQDPDYLDDPVIKDYVQDIWQRLIAASRARGEMSDDMYEAYAWDILMGRDRTVNAFALPGGYFGLHLGLVSIVSTRDELASVLAHELSHVTQRHISRSIARQDAQTPWLVGSMILGLLAASQNPGGAQALIMGGQAAAAQSQLNYSRGMEREADRIGFNVSSQAGFAPLGFVSMFEKLQQASRLNDMGGFPYLRTHPLTTERIADMQQRVQLAPPAAALPDDVQAPLIIAARARVLCNPDVDSLRLWGQQIAPAHLASQAESAQVATLYGATFAAMKLHAYDDAQSRLRRLQHEVALELALLQNQVEQSARLSQGLDLTSRPELLLQLQSSVLNGHADAAAQTAQTWLVDHPRDALAWQALASAYTALGRSVSAVRAEAEVNVAQLDYSTALTRLRAAQDLQRKGGAGAGDYIEASILDTRVHEVTALVKEMAAER